MGEGTHIVHNCDRSMVCMHRMQRQEKSHIVEGKENASWDSQALTLIVVST